MDSFNQYGSGSSDSENDSEASSQRKRAKPLVRQYKIDTAPEVGGCSATMQLAAYIQPGQREINSNLTYDVMTQPSEGPVDSEGTFVSRVSQQGTSGHAEIQAVDETMFRSQERMFRQHGTAHDPSVNAQGTGSYIQSTVTSSGKNNGKLKRKAKGDVSVISGPNAYLGPWAGYEGETKGQITGPTPEQQAEYDLRQAENTTASGSIKKPKGRLYIDGQEERSIFHGQSEYDSLGRTYMHIPSQYRHEVSYEELSKQSSFVPKSLVKEWKSAHPGGVSAIRFIPSSGHLLLSSGMDGTVKIFDAHSSYALQRTYIGHSKAVRDISFSPTGTTFLSSSYDSFTKLWDTETGKCLQRFEVKSKKIPNVARFYPEDPNVFLVGQSDKKIVQWDIRANEIVQQYNQHLDAINSLTFFDSSRRFISTSDDKSMRVWEFGIPVVIKLIADPSMHAVPSVALHPSNKWLVGQSMDNRLVVYSTSDKFKQNRRKEFTGHLSAGFACHPSFSPNGRILTSGDAEGQVWCWDWQTKRVLTKWKAHEKVTIDTAWHPRETSRVATCSWDGTIKYWN
ncbi:hypothetical protein IW150_000926 [Coemansia sp. RSA 2607]|nr:hypothetical protein IW150_000926 [Coemansia sp. RSA 2607]